MLDLRVVEHARPAPHCRSWFVQAQDIWAEGIAPASSHSSADRVFIHLSE